MTKEEALQAWSEAYQDWVSAYVKAEAKIARNAGLPGELSVEDNAEEKEFSAKAVELMGKANLLAFECSPVRQTIVFALDVARKIQGFDGQRVYRAIGVAMHQGFLSEGEIAFEVNRVLTEEDALAARGAGELKEKHALAEALKPSTAPSQAFDGGHLDNKPKRK